MADNALGGDPHRQLLERLGARGRLRALAPRAGVDFTSNDYLGLAESAALCDAAASALARGVPVGAGGSRLLRGNHPEHEALEGEAAAFFGSETALYFPTGFAANAALVATLPRPGDLIVYDALIHASLHAGLDPARIAARPAPHNDVNAMEDVIRSWRQGGGKGRVWIAVETLYSMDGDKAPLADLAALAARHGAMLLVDEAHATGVFGPKGRGLGSALEGAENVISLHTCGKALGVAGALICLPRLYRDVMINRGRSFIYSTAPSPLTAAVVRAALRLCANADAQRAVLMARVEQVGTLARKLGIAPSGTQIQPVIVGADAAATRLAGALQARGFDIRAIRPPTVPEGTARLRIALSVNVSQTAAAALFAALAEEMVQT